MKKYVAQTKRKIPHIHISVHNMGTPLTDEDQRKIFEPFEKARTPRRRDNKGWGIGLTLVRGTVEAHGGKIQISSSHQDGTIFTIITPLDSRPYQSEEAA